MNKRFLSFSIMAVLCLGAMADDVQTVTVNGSTVSKTVTQITFEGDNVILHYSDGTSAGSVDLDNVEIAFNTANAIKALSTEPADAPIYYFDMSGRQLQQAPQKGMYIMKKGNKVVKLINK